MSLNGSMSPSRDAAASCTDHVGMIQGIAQKLRRVRTPTAQIWRGKCKPSKKHPLVPTHAECLEIINSHFWAIMSKETFMLGEQDRRLVMRQRLWVVAGEPRAWCCRPSCG